MTMKTIHTKNNPTGKRVKFIHAGCMMIGTVEEINQRLTDLYQHEWYWVKEASEGHRYPIALDSMKFI